MIPLQTTIQPPSSPFTPLQLSLRLPPTLANTSENRFGKPAQVLLEGVSIGVLKMLEEKFPEAPFVVTGVLGPHSNAHGPNENLHLPFVKKLTGCVADVLSAFSQ